MVQKWIKRAAIFLAIIIFIIAGFLLFLHTPIGKSIVRQKVENYLQQKWATRVDIGNIDYRLPNWIALENVLILDRQKDTLLSGSRLYAGINLLELLSNTIDITGISLEAITLNCRREIGDSVFNFQFILDAFASPPSENPTPSKDNPMRLSVNKLFLDKVSFSFQDKKEKSYISVIIDSFSCFPDELNLKKTIYHFNEVQAANSYINIVDSSSVGNSDSKTVTKNRGDPDAILLFLKKLNLQGIHFSYHKPYNKTNFTFQVGSLQLDHSSLDLRQQIIKSGNVRLSNADVNILTYVTANKATKAKETKLVQSSDTPDNWKISVDAIALRNNSFVYNNTAAPVTKGIDVQHITVQDITLETKNSSFDSSGFFSELNIYSLLFNNYINLNRLSAIVRITDKLLNIKDLTGAVNQSQLFTKGDLAWQLKSGTNPIELPVLRISNSIINYKDLLLIQPNLSSLLPFSLLPSEKIMLSGNFTGPIQNLVAKEIRLTTSSKLFQLYGNISLKIGKTGVDLTAMIHQLQLKKQLLSKKLLDQLDKDKIMLPDEMAITGKVKVNSEMLQTDIKLNSVFGQLYIKGITTNINHLSQLTYDFHLDADNFETGKCIGLEPQLGKISGQILIKGYGIQKNNLAASAKLQLRSAIINGHSISNIDMEGELRNSEFTTKAQIHDPDLQSELNLSGHISPGTVVHGNIQIGRVNLAKLGLSSDTIVLASSINVDANYLQPQKLEANIQADSSTVTINEKNVFVDRLSIICKSDSDSTLLMTSAPFMNATLKSNYPVNKLSSEISSFLRTIYPVNDPKREKYFSPSIRKHQTSFNLILTQDELLSSFVPGLELAHPITVNGSLDAGKMDSFLFIQVIAPGLRYNNYVGDDLQFKAESSDSVIHFALSGRDIMNGTNLLSNPAITGQLHKDLLLIKGRVEDRKGIEYYSGSLEVKLGKNGTFIRLLDDLTLNYNKWKVPADNRVLVLKDGFVVNNLSLENRGQKLLINSKDSQVISPIDIKIDSFDIGNILSITSLNDSMMARGTLRADMSIQQPIKKVPLVTGFINAKNLEVFNIPVGDLNFYSTTNGDSLLMNGGISGNNKLDFSGSLHPAIGKINIQTRLEKLDVSLFQEFVKGLLTNVSGQLTGELQLKGSTNTIQCQGYLGLDSATFAVKDLNALYKIDKQKIYIDYPEINFRQFTLSDKANNQLTVQGKVKVISKGEYGLDLDIDTKNLIVLDAIRQPGSPIYGTGILDAKVGIKGTSNEPTIEGNAYLQDKSKVHFILSSKSGVTKSRKGGIIFVDIDTISLPIAESAGPLKDAIATSNKFKGLKYNLNLRVDKDAEFTVIIDPSTNDELVIRGEGRLNAGLIESGDMGITGVYHLQSGYYKMNNLLLKGKFMLVKGSTITFNGDPMSAVADVSTEYLIEASPKGLLAYKETDDEVYSQKLPFVVIFMIKGPVSKPILSFDIKLKEGKASITSSMRSEIEHELQRLRNDISAMNQQVFSLLLTKRFTGTSGYNSLESSNLNVNNALKEGVSSFLTEAMNQVADQLIKGVDIDVNMKSYKTGDDPISKTDLGVAMSKDLLQNRMVITVEENITLNNEGTSSAQKSGSQYVPDITSTYKLSKDGHFQVKAYQKNEFDAVVQGYFTEVGVSFTFELSYDKFKELIRRKKNLSNEEK